MLSAPHAAVSQQDDFAPSPSAASPTPHQHPTAAPGQPVSPQLFKAIGVVSQWPIRRHTHLTLPPPPPPQFLAAPLVKKEPKQQLGFSL